jgi:hypothetical protein
MPFQQYFSYIVAVQVFCGGHLDNPRKPTTHRKKQTTPSEGIRNLFNLRDRRGSDRMVVGFTSTYAISDYHH